MTDTNWGADSDHGEVHQNGEIEAPRRIDLPDELPPVEPPSAGMIVQLFLVPAVIVGVIVGMYVLFGKMVSQEMDWRHLAAEVSSENPHIRWRGALGLAQMMDADAQRGEKSQNLSARPEIATALTALYGKLTQSNSPTEEELKQIEFLSKALGRMRVPDVIAPVFRSGIQPDRPHDVRKHSLIGLAMLAGTMSQHDAPLEQPDLVQQVIEISREPEPLFRHQATYTLGLLPAQESLDRLQVLLEDPDQMVRVNAAIGLARNENGQGVAVFHELLEEASGWKLDPSSVKTSEEESTYFERMLMVLNSMKAVSQLEPKLTAADRQRFAAEVGAVIESTDDRVLQVEARELESRLK